MNVSRKLQRNLAFGLLLALAILAATGYYSIRRDVQNLKEISRDNILWTAMQMEVELLRFELSLATLEIERTPEALENVLMRFDILWSRIFMMTSGRVGEAIRRYDRDASLSGFRNYLTAIDPIVVALSPRDSAGIRSLLDELEVFRAGLRLYTLRVVRGDTAAVTVVRERIQSSSQTTMLISLAAMALGLLALGLILRDNRRQFEIAELNRRIAAEAEVSSRAKSRFLTMMSHELRNPLNGVLGPLALLARSDAPARLQPLIEQAQQAGRTMVQMLNGLMDYGQIQDGGLTLRSERFRPALLATKLQADLDGAGAARVFVSPEMPDLLDGDVERLRQIFGHLVEFLLDGGIRVAIEIGFRHDAGVLIGEIAISPDDAVIARKIDLMMGLDPAALDQVSTEALRPLIARGLIAAADGALSVERADARHVIRIAIAAAIPGCDRFMVWLETRSSALDAICRATLRSDLIVFIGEDDPSVADMVLVDAASVGEHDVMDRLRTRFPEAQFVLLGAQDDADAFDDVIDGPADMSRLRSTMLRRVAG